jgi:hypothetical protein
VERNPNFNRFGPLVEMADAGHFDLPTEVVSAHQVAAKLTAEVSRRRPERANEARRKLVAAIVEAARTGAPWPDGREVVEAEAADRADHEAAVAVDRAAGAAQAEFTQLVADMAEDIIVGSLRPAVEHVLAETRRVTQVLAPYGAGNVERLLTAPKAAREAWLTLDALAGRYGVLRRARAILVRTQDQLDGAALFAEVRNMHELWPAWRQRVESPAPTGARERMCWLTRPEVEAWMPTAAEQDARYREVFAQGMAQAARARAAGAGGLAPLPAA